MDKKKKAVRKHSVWANMQVVELAKAGSAMDLEIYAGKEKLGRIVIGRGSFTWFGKGRQNGVRVNWSKFAKMMDEYCYD